MVRKRATISNNLYCFLVFVIAECMMQFLGIIIIPIE